MISRIKNIRGNKTLWSAIFALALFSFWPNYTTSSNPAYLYGDGNTSLILIKHAFHLFFGFIIIFLVHRIDYNYYKRISVIMVLVIIILLTITLFFGTSVNSASRWIRIGGVSFQTSAFAIYVSMMYTAAFLSKKNGVYNNFKECLYLLIPLAVIVLLVFPSNLSTAMLIFISNLTLMLIGKFPFKYMFRIIGSTCVIALIFFLMINVFSDYGPVRAKTWSNRISSFINGDTNETYQSNGAMEAVKLGGWFGIGPGKSTMKNFLPQSFSDFIFAIITEESGLVGAIVLILLYIGILHKSVQTAVKIKDTFGMLLVMGMILPIIFQAVIHIGVVVGIFPVTGQPLPLMSSGGSAIWATCIALGVILGVSKHVVTKNKVKEVNV
ncbi:FtsW/RodA/SpoVE family cell cycle protein [Ichthyobacterium seriolicida]|uniref:Probable peptidoglycan glycosyltransferase FtsW n=1 Tax=Ichthyobacterium seriolicida TaxID=242600 RepID=A0A1J1E7E1_9FLAO|nr:FtsW/RodA/SpoVE family cell cycle protein [Ichthyobacterium seriolicida]BAV95254.1 cell division protein FtsW [Ichthyobacterium seriolicida]